MSATSPARVRALFEYAIAFRRALDDPGILEGDRVMHVTDEYMAGPSSTPQLEDTGTALMEQRSPMGNAWSEVTAIFVDSQDEVEEGQDPSDVEWKRRLLESMKGALDRFITLNPEVPATAPAAGGKRRKTRKGKAKPSRRARYSRRR